MTSPAGSVRQRKKAKESPAVTPPAIDEKFHSVVKAKPSDWDYKLALTIITILGFVTRFWGISHPDEVVFDEVHFGKVGSKPSLISLQSHQHISHIIKSGRPSFSADP